MNALRSLLLIAVFGCGSGSLMADGGRVVSQGERGAWIITLFAAPGDLHAGPADLSVLVQDRDTKQAILDADVSLALIPPASSTGETWKPPCCSMRATGDLSNLPASRDQAQNKLLYASYPDLDRPGDWGVTVTVARGDMKETIAGQFQVAPPSDPFMAYWPLLALPLAAIAGFILHRRACRSKGRAIR